jgi:signal transduction histidine kinase
MSSPVLPVPREAALRLLAFGRGEEERLALCVAVFVAVCAGLVAHAWATAGLWLLAAAGAQVLGGLADPMVAEAERGRRPWRRAEWALAGAGAVTALVHASIVPVFWLYGGEAGRLCAILLTAGMVLHAGVTAEAVASVLLARLAPPLLVMAGLLLAAPPGAGSVGALVVACLGLLFLQQMRHAFDLAERGRIAEAAALEAVAAGQREARAARAMTAALRALIAPEAAPAGSEPTRYAPRRLGAALEAVWSPVAAEKGLTLRMQFDRDVPQDVSGHPDRVRQIVGAMIAAAVDSLESGAVVVEVAARLAPDGSRRLAWMVRGGAGLEGLSLRTPGWAASQGLAAGISGALSVDRAGGAALPVLALETPALAPTHADAA